MQVLVGTHVVLANGGIMAPVGTHVVALAAKHHSCPFVVLTGLHKLSPLFPHDPSVTFNDFRVRFQLQTGMQSWLVGLTSSTCSLCISRYTAHTCSCQQKAADVWCVLCMYC